MNSERDNAIIGFQHFNIFVPAHSNDFLHCLCFHASSGSKTQKNNKTTLPFIRLIQMYLMEYSTFPLSAVENRTQGPVVNHFEPWSKGKFKMLGIARQESSITVQ